MRTIIAQSGAGKTTFCKKRKWCKDGDYLKPLQHVYHTMGREFGKDWSTSWTKDKNERYVKLTEEAVRKLSGVKGWMTIANVLFANSDSVFVIPSPGVVSQRLSKPRHDHDHSHDLERARNADKDRETYLKSAKQLGCLVFESFDALEAATVL